MTLALQVAPAAQTTATAIDCASFTRNDSIQISFQFVISYYFVSDTMRKKKKRPEGKQRRVNRKLCFREVNSF